MKTNCIFLIIVVALVVYWESAFDGVRRLLGVQPDLLPPLMVYVGLTQGLARVALVGITGGLLFDSLSANPFGASVVPYFLSGFTIYLMRDLVLRDEPFAHVVLGAVAGFASGLCMLIILLTMGMSPVLGWGTLWQLTVLTVGAAVSAPIWFVCFDWLNRKLSYKYASEGAFRSDREIRRGRR